MARWIIAIIATASIALSGCYRQNADSPVSHGNPTQNREQDKSNETGEVEPASRSKLQRFQFEHASMGIRFSAIVFADSREVAENAISRSWERVDQLDQMLSDYRRDSDIMQLALGAPHVNPVVVNPELWQLLRQSSDLSEKTDGAFDITVGPASHLWRGAIKRNRLPSADQISRAAKSIGWKNLELGEGNTVRLLLPEMQLDFGGIAQGFAGDCVTRILQEAKIASALVDASGDIVVLGSQADSGEPWSIEIPAVGDIPPITIPLVQGSVSTSGDLEQSLVIDGQRYSHLVDPRTGQALTHSTLVTVIAPTGLIADALASALSVLPPDQALRMAEEWDGVEARIVSRLQENPDKLLVQQTTGFNR